MRKVFLLVAFQGVFLYSLCEGGSYEEAVQFYRNGNYLLSRRTLEELISGGNKLKARTYLDLASLYKQSADYEEGIDLLENLSARRLSRDLRRRVYEMLGQLYYLNGDSERALAVFRKVETGFRDFPWHVYLYLGLVYESLSNPEKAGDYYLKTLSVRRSSIASYRLAKLFYRDKDYGKARHYFSLTLDIDSSMKLANYYMGECRLMLGDYASAYNDFYRMFILYPRNRRVKERMELVKEKLGKEHFVKTREAVDSRRRKVALKSFTRPDKPGPLVKVGIIEKASMVSFKCGGDFSILSGGNEFRGVKNELYTLSLAPDGKICLLSYKEGRKLAGFASPVKMVSGRFPFHFLSVSCGKGDFWQKRIDNSYRGDMEVRITGNKLTVINSVSMEEYLYGVVPAEIPANSPVQALKAQAVAARTIAFRNVGRHKREGFDFCGSTHCQVYRGFSTETKRTNQAVDSTRGEIMLYNGKPIEAFYHSNCGGCLRADIFGDTPYLFGDKTDSPGGACLPDSPWRAEVWFKDGEECFCVEDKKSNFRWQRVYDSADFEMVFGKKFSRVAKIAVLEKGECAHNKRMEVCYADGAADSLEGDLNIRRYFDDLKSSAFIMEVKYGESGQGGVPEMIFFWGSGFGHGAGMCQEGSVAMAEKGTGYKEILNHYYKDISIERAY